jgi:hypothetical protein
MTLTESTLILTLAVVVPMAQLRISSLESEGVYKAEERTLPGFPRE